MSDKSNKLLSSVLLILIIILVFNFVSNLFKLNTDPQIENQTDKFAEVLEYIDAFYVDDVKWEKPFEKAINGMLSSLDPHSLYFNIDDAQQNDENYAGKYQGIGIQFDVIDRYLTVIAPIPGSPSERLGLQSGDRIIKIDGVNAIGITTRQVEQKLKGPAGSEVKLTVIRDGVDDDLEFTIRRDVIPIISVNSYFVEPDGTGYILLSSFAQTSEQEIESAMRELESQGMQRLILDLRWNAGGALDQAVKLAARFLDGHEMIVYTKGRIPQFNEEFYADTYEKTKSYDLPLIVLVNHASASASEIVAGAIQDHDRGLIIGTNSFGKGLVQREFKLDDGSHLRLTISKYYTPSGRLIQRAYKNKDLATYYNEVDDSTIVVDSSITRPEFKTDQGRVVYGGGGITPDIKIESGNTPKSGKLISKLVQKRLFFETASKFARKHADWKQKDADFLKEFEVPLSLVDALHNKAVTKKIEFNEKVFNQDRGYMRHRLKWEIVRQIWGNKHYYRALLEDDRQYEVALESFKKINEILVTGSRRSPGDVAEVQEK